MQAGVEAEAGSACPERAVLRLVISILGRWGGRLWRKKLLIAALTCSPPRSAFAVVNSDDAAIQVEARVLIETRENIFFRPMRRRRPTAPPPSTRRRVTSQVQLILSRDLARDVIKKLKLAERPNSIPCSAAQAWCGTWLSLLGIIKDPMEMTPEERVFRAITIGSPRSRWRSRA